MYFPCIYPNPNKLLSLALTVMITNTPKYGWRRCDVHMNIDTVLYIDILIEDIYTFKNKSALSAKKGIVLHY